MRIPEITEKQVPGDATTDNFDFSLYQKAFVSGYIVGKEKDRSFSILIELLTKDGKKEHRLWRLDPLLPNEDPAAKARGWNEDMKQAIRDSRARDKARAEKAKAASK
jgi:hypothetical protein